MIERADFEIDVIHSHHLWLMSAVLKDIAPDTPVLTHCHATGLRQMELCPHLAPQVRAGCSRNDAFAVLHRGHAEELARCLGISTDRIHRVVMRQAPTSFNRGAPQRTGQGHRRHGHRRGLVPQRRGSRWAVRRIDRIYRLLGIT